MLRSRERMRHPSRLIPPKSEGELLEAPLKPLLKPVLASVDFMLSGDVRAHAASARLSITGIVARCAVAARACTCSRAPIGEQFRFAPRSRAGECLRMWCPAPVSAPGGGSSQWMSSQWGWCLGASQRLPRREDMPGAFIDSEDQPVVPGEKAHKLGP